MAVYTRITFAEAEKLAKEFSLGDLLRLTEIKEGVENSNFILETASGKFILTIFEKRVKRGDLPFFLELMEHFALKKIPCPKTLHNKSHNRLSTIHGKPAAIITFLNGKSHLHPSPVDCMKAGEVLAKMHLAASYFKAKRKNNLSLDGWKELVEKISKLPNAEEDAISLFKKEIIYLNRNWPEEIPSAVIHADFFPNNVFFEKGQISGVIDFYFACYDFLAYDLAIVISAWCFDGEVFSTEKFDALIKGYESVRKLSTKEKEALPALCRGAALRFLLTRYHDFLTHNPDDLVEPLNPQEYLAKLEFFQTVGVFDGYKAKVRNNIH